MVTVISQLRMFTPVRLALLLLALSSVGPVSAAPVAPVLQDASPVKAELVIPDGSVLPGVPFDMWINLENRSDASVGVGLCADMIVRPETGPSFTLACGRTNGPSCPTLLPENSWRSAPVRYVVLQPHQKQVLTIPIAPELEGPIYFADPRLSPPGKYGITLRLDYCWPGFTTPQKGLLPPEFMGTVTTNEVTVARPEPTGSDAEVWQRMNEVSKGAWVPTMWGVSEAGHQISLEIAARYPDSHYLPYMLLANGFGNRNDVQLDRVLSAIERFHDSPVLDHLHLEARVLLSRYCGSKSARGKSCDNETAFIDRAVRPTTRILAFGREGAPKEPCPPEYDCQN